MNCPTQQYQQFVFHSLFQNYEGKIFACGSNQAGQCGLGHFDSPQITPSLILNLPSNIVQFGCGSSQSLFLDSEGNAYFVGHGSLFLGHNTNQNVLNKITNIPPIRTISCIFASCYLLDGEGNLWTFGLNNYWQLGHYLQDNKILLCICFQLFYLYCLLFDN